MPSKHLLVRELVVSGPDRQNIWGWILGMGRYTYLPIRYYHDTCADTICIVIFLKNFDSTSIAFRYCYVLWFLFLTLDHGKKFENLIIPLK